MSDEDDTGQEAGEDQEGAEAANETEAANEPEAKAPDESELGLEELDDDTAAAMASGEDSEDDEEISSQGKTAADLEAVFDIPVNVSAVLGKARLPVSQLLKLGKGAVVELDRKVGEAIDIYVNNRLVARGEVVVVEDHLGVTMTEIIKSDNH